MKTMLFPASYPHAARLTKGNAQQPAFGASFNETFKTSLQDNLSVTEQSRVHGAILAQALETLKKVPTEMLTAKSDRLNTVNDDHFRAAIRKTNYTISRSGKKEGTVCYHYSYQTDSTKPNYRYYTLVLNPGKHINFRDLTGGFDFSVKREDNPQVFDAFQHYFKSLDEAGFFDRPSKTLTKLLDAVKKLY